MKIVFMGTPAFAVESLRMLISHGYAPEAVVTAPDKPAGRGQKLSQSPVKSFAVEHSLRVLQPEKLKDAEFIEQLRGLKADLFLVVAFRMLPEVVWSMPRLGTFNLHASLLPAYRGAAPINHAIISGEKVTGLTTFKLRHEIDSGDVLFREKVAISEDMTAGELHDLLMVKGAALLLKTVQAIADSDARGEKLNFLRQDETRVSHAPKLFREMCRIDWSLQPRSVHDFVRGLSPVPGAFTFLIDGAGRQQLKILRTIIPGTNDNDGVLPGTVNTDGKSFLHVKCKGGWIGITELQPEGRKRMRIEEFLRGFRIQSHEIRCE